jgi:hypothetical protein
MTDDVKKFEDPMLKSAIRQIRGEKGASQELVARVKAALAQERAAQANAGEASGREDGVSAAETLKLPRPGTSRALINPMRKLITALAALILVTIGGMKLYTYYQATFNATGTLYGMDDLMRAMVAVHQAGDKGQPTTQQLSAPINNPDALVAEASAKLGRPIPDVDLSSQGWKLVSAGYCTIQGSPSVAFHYVQQSSAGAPVKAITLISMPTTLLRRVQTPNYEQMFGSNPISGYVRGASLNCVVGDPSMPLPEVTALRDAIKHG